jgi:hypothetical protein
MGYKKANQSFRLMQCTLEGRDKKHGEFQHLLREESTPQSTLFWGADFIASETTQRPTR